jgi:hypothetical protein
MEVSPLSHVTNAALVVYILQYLKRTEWYQRFATALPLANDRVHVGMSALGAFATSVGMHVAVEGNSDAGWHLMLSVPPLWVLAHALWDWAQQMSLNQIVFALAVQRKEAAPVVTTQVRDTCLTG